MAASTRMAALLGQLNSPPKPFQPKVVPHGVALEAAPAPTAPREVTHASSPLSAAEVEKP
jgi:hypothetical protein